MGTAVQQIAVFLDELFHRQLLCQLSRLFRDKLFVIQLRADTTDASARGGDTAAGGGSLLQHDAEQRKTRKGRFIDVIPPPHRSIGVIRCVRIAHRTPTRPRPSFGFRVFRISLRMIAPAYFLPVEALPGFGRFVKIEALVHFQHTVQKGMAVLSEALVRERDAQRSQHFYDGGILLHVIGAELGKAAAGELLLRQVSQRFADSRGDLWPVHIGREGLHRLGGEQDAGELFGIDVQSVAFHVLGPLGIAEPAIALLAGQHLRQHSLPRGVAFIRFAGVTGGVQIQQHIHLILIRLHQLRSLHGSQKVVTGKVGHVQPHGRHRADSAGNIARLAALCRNVHPVRQRPQVVVIKAVRHVCAGGPQGIDHLGVFLLRGCSEIVFALGDALDDQLRHRLVRLLRLICPAVHRGSLRGHGQEHDDCQQCSQQLCNVFFHITVPS